MANIVTTPEFRELLLETGTVLPAVDGFGLDNQGLLDELDETGDFSAVSLASDRIVTGATNPFTGGRFETEFTGSGIAPVSTLDALEQAIIDGLASGALDRVSVTKNGFEFLALDISAGGYTLTSGQQSLDVTGALPTSLQQIGDIVSAVEALEAAFTVSSEQAAFDTLLAELQQYEINALVSAGRGCRGGAA